MPKVIQAAVLALIAVLTFCTPVLADDGTGWACGSGDCAGSGPAGPGGGGTGGSGAEPSPPNLWDGMGDLITEEVTDIICGGCAPDLDTSAFSQ